MNGPIKKTLKTLQEVLLICSNLKEIKQETKGNNLIWLLYSEKRGSLSNCDDVHALPKKLGKCSLQMERSKAQRPCPAGVVCSFMQADRMSFDRE